jgi:hypothetical protein
MHNTRLVNTIYYPNRYYDNVWTDIFFSIFIICRVILFATASRPALRPTQPLNEWVTGDLLPGSKRPGHESDHSLPYSDEAKKERAEVHFHYPIRLHDGVLSLVQDTSTWRRTKYVSILTPSAATETLKGPLMHPLIAGEDLTCPYGGGIWK